MAQADTLKKEIQQKTKKMSANTQNDSEQEENTAQGLPYSPSLCKIA